MKFLLLFIAGGIFSSALVLSEMTKPEKVRAFLDFTGNWDPSLLFVLGSAVLTYGVIFRVVSKTPKPIFESRFEVPQNRKITPKLLIGAAIFGVGWGLSGLCPGPAFAAIFASKGIFTFVIAIMVGMGLSNIIEKFKRAEDIASEL